MKKLSAICMALIVAIVSEGVEGMRSMSRSNLITGSPKFFDKFGPSFFKIHTSTYDENHDCYNEVILDDVCFPVKLYCMPNDTTYCLFFDLLGNIAGYQICYIREYADTIDPNVYNFSGNPNFYHTHFYGRDLYCVRIWFTNPEELTKSGRTDLSEIIEGLYTYIDGKLIRFDQRCQTLGPTIGDFDLNSCLPMVGTIYVHKFNKYVNDCKYGFYLFLVYDQMTLVGFGHAVPGTFPPGPTRDWFNHPHGEKLAEIVPSTPKCFEDFLPYGISSSITFLIDDPHNIKCPVCGC